MDDMLDSSTLPLSEREAVAGDSGAVSVPDIAISQPFDKIVGALADAMLAITPPRRTKEATIHSKRTGRTYRYAYAPLEEVLSAVTKPLASRGLILTQMPHGRDLDVALLHPSGQWMMVTMPLQVGEDTGMAGALTTARRLGIQALLSLAADDDTDNQAKDDISTPHWDPDLEKRDEGVHPLLLKARETANADQGCDLIEFSMRYGLHLDKLRGDDATREEWETFIREVSAALDRSVGTTIAGVWKAAMTAQTAEHWAAIAEKRDNGWSEILSKFRAQRPVAAGNLMRMLNERSAAFSRIQSAARQAAERAGQGQPPNEIGDVIPALAGPTSRDAEIDKQTAGGEGFCYAVLNAYGEPVGVELTDPIAWAKAFADLRAAEKHSFRTREAIDQHNMDALTDANKVFGAEIILTEAFAPIEEPAAVSAETPDPQTWAIEPPRRGSSIDVNGYLKLVEGAVATLRNREDLVQWEDNNRDTYSANPALTGRVLKVLAGHKRKLGIPAPGAE